MKVETGFTVTDGKRYLFDGTITGEVDSPADLLRIEKALTDAGFPTHVNVTEGRGQAPPTLPPPAATAKPGLPLAAIEAKRGEGFMALAHMLAQLSDMDRSRLLALFRTVARERLDAVELDVMRHLHFARFHKAAGLCQFRILYGRLFDLATVASEAESTVRGASNDQVFDLLGDLLIAVTSLAARPYLINVPPFVQRSGIIGGAWSHRGAEGSPAHLGGTTEPLTDELLPPGVLTGNPGNKPATPAAGFPPGATLT